MDTAEFVDSLVSQNINFFSGVPDSLLNALCLELINSKSCKVIIGAHEGNSLALAAGHYMASGNVPCVFMQNSGLGNIVNPYTSLAHQKVYGLPMLFIVGWRGEPGVKDEPQHLFMGEITLKLLELLQIEYEIIDKNTTLQQIETSLKGFQHHFSNKKSCAFVVRKGAFTGGGKINTQNNYEIVREQAIEHIVSTINKDDLVISSTGKISRELFETRERLGQSHKADFLTVGSMGFASSIAAQISQEKPNKRVICIDGDGAALMHMGCMATIGSLKLDNLVHIILDNQLHQSVGGVPTISGGIDWTGLAKSLGYKGSQVIYNKNQLDTLNSFKAGELVVIKVNEFSRPDLGRPTTSAQENIAMFTSYVQQNRL